MAPTDPRPRWRPWWLALGVVPLGVITWLALTPALPPGIPSVWDKAQHALAFAALALWFRNAGFGMVVVGSSGLAYGILIEILQGCGGVRVAEFGDVVGDAAGLCMGEGLARTPLGHILRGCETWIHSPRESDS